VVCAVSDSAHRTCKSAPCRKEPKPEAIPLVGCVGYARRRMEPRRDRATSRVPRRMLAGGLRNPEFLVDLERLRAEMVEYFAPAADGPVVNPGRRRHGRLVFGDATE